MFFVFMIIDLVANFSNKMIMYNHGALSIVMFALATLLIFWLEFKYFYLYKQLKTFNLSMDLLIAIATHLTYLFSIIISLIKIITTSSINTLNMEFWEVGYSLSFFIGIGYLVENNLKQKSSLGIKDLLKLQNKNSLLKTKDGFKEIKSSQLKIGDVVKIIKGQSIPTDGKLISKSAYLDCSSLFGESEPRMIKQNDYVVAGAIVTDNHITYKVTKTMENSTLAKIIKQLEGILKNKAKVERISEKIVKYFLPSVIILSVITFILWMILTFNNIKLPIELPWQEYNYDTTISKIQLAIFNAAGVLVIACPCAFGIATPAAIYSSSFIASKHKILFASAEAYEKLNKIKYVAFDKTGTLTYGKPKVIKEIGDNSYDNIIFEMVKHSTHPLSLAIKKYLSKKQNNALNLKEIKETAGVGIHAKYNKNEFFLGSINYSKINKFTWKVKINDDELGSFVVFAINKKVVKYYQIKDEIKNDSLKIINKFKKLNIEPIILSGDLEKNVENVAKKLNIENYYANLLPDQKANIILEYKKKGNILFVGDGINDLLAIKSANVGIAFSSGSEITNSLADISLLENDLSLVYKTFILSKRTIQAIKINFVWAGIFNLTCVPLTMIGMIPIWLGVILMTSSTIFLLINTLIYKYKNDKFLLKKI